MRLCLRRLPYICNLIAQRWTDRCDGHLPAVRRSLTCGVTRIPVCASSVQQSRKATLYASPVHADGGLRHKHLFLVIVFLFNALHHSYILIIRSNSISVNNLYLTHSRPTAYRWPISFLLIHCSKLQSITCWREELQVIKYLFCDTYVILNKIYNTKYF